MKVAYLHGLESNIKGDKNLLLKTLFDDVYDPLIDYSKDGVWERLYKGLSKFKPDVIIGSSMGGWFAYNYGKKMGIDTILFNPAMQDRSIEPKVDTSGKKKPFNKVIFGMHDVIIDPKKSEEFLKADKAKFSKTVENMGHRTPYGVFGKHLQ